MKMSFKMGGGSQGELGGRGRARLWPIILLPLLGSPQADQADQAHSRLTGLTRLTGALVSSLLPKRGGNNKHPIFADTFSPKVQILPQERSF